MAKKIGESIHVADSKSGKLQGRVTTKGKKISTPNQIPLVEIAPVEVAVQNDIEKAHQKLERIKTLRTLNGQCLTCGDSIKAGSPKFLNRQEASKTEFTTTSEDEIEYQGFLCADCAGVTTSVAETPPILANRDIVRTTLTGPNEFLVAVPFLVGYQPKNSIVIAGIEDGSIGLALRVDYPTEADAPYDALVFQLTKQHVEGAFVVAYTPEGCTNGLKTLRDIAEALSRAGIPMHESILVNHDNRWRSALCNDPQCCPLEGREMPDITVSNVAANQVMNGTPMPFASADEMRESISPLALASDEGFISAVKACTVPRNNEDKQLQREGAVATLDLFSVFNAGGIPSEELCAKVLGCLNDIQVRDFAFGSIRKETMPVYANMWKHLTRIAPAGHVAPVATLLAGASYESGDGALARMALNRAMADDSEYSLARLLSRQFGRGIPPAKIAELRDELHPKVCADIFDGA